MQAQEKTKVFVSDTQSWEMSGGWGTSEGSGGGVISGGARPQTVEVMKTVQERCPEIGVTNNKSKAAFVMLLDHEGGKGLVRKDNKVAVFNREGDLVFTKSTRSLGNAIKDACDSMTTQPAAK